MHRYGHDINRKIVSVVLAVFLVGGLLAPVLHRAHHGLAWTKLHHEAPQTCDHAGHSDSFEATAPAFLDDDCLLCVRHLLLFVQAPASSPAYSYAAYGVPLQAPPEILPFNKIPIRGPPSAS